MKAKQAQNKNQTRKRYSAEFREQALQRADKDGIPQAAKDLGLAPSQLYAWRKSQQMAAQTTDEQRLQQAEIARLKREVARLKEEAEFLKKAAAYFAKETKRGTP